MYSPSNHEISLDNPNHSSCPVQVSRAKLVTMFMFTTKQDAGPGGKYVGKAPRAIAYTLKAYSEVGVKAPIPRNI